VAHPPSWLPEAWRSLFWDSDSRTLNREQHRRYVIERVLELGDQPAVRALFTVYARDDIGEVVLTSRQLSRRSAEFWALVLGLEERPFACTKPSWTEQPLIS
jgi:hypothetical protein